VIPENALSGAFFFTRQIVLTQSQSMLLPHGRSHFFAGVRRDFSNFGKKR
jgi:hypothetical protein